MNQKKSNDSCKSTKNSDSDNLPLGEECSTKTEEVPDSVLCGTDEMASNPKDDESADTQVAKRPIHRFKKGISGNPGGRPKGAKNKLTLLKEAILQESESIIIEHFPKVVQAVVKAAEKGDMTAAKMLLDRMIPTKRAVEVTGKDGKDFGIKIIVQSAESVEHSGVEKIIEGEVIDENEQE